MDRQTKRRFIKMNGANSFLNPENIDLSTKIIILCALVQKYGTKAFLYNGSEYNAPVFGQHTDCKNLGIG